MYCRKRAFSLTLILVLVGVGIAGLWLRSNVWADRLHGRLWDRHSFVIAAKQGRLTIVKFRSHGAPGWWQWELRSYKADDEMSFPVGPVDQYTNDYGFGTIDNPIYSVMSSTIQRPDRTTFIINGAASATLRGSGIIVPYWFLICLTFLALMATVTAYQLRPVPPIPPDQPQQ